MTFSADEMASAFDTLQRADRVQGIFLSSGIIKGSVTTQDKIIDTIEIIRHRKDFTNELLKMLRWAEVIRRENPHQKLARTVTQFVVGAVGDTDQELLSLSERLYRHAGLTRAYYSGFSPVEQTPFENLTSTDPLREFRLYQASFLLRDYGWSIHDLDFLQDGNMRTDVDPKHAWAERHLRQSPLEIMTAERAQLLRIPGIGPIGADKIIHARRQGRIADLSQLRKLKIRAPEQAAPYILLGGHRPAAQMSLF